MQRPLREETRGGPVERYQLLWVNGIPVDALRSLEVLLGYLLQIHFLALLAWGPSDESDGGNFRLGPFHDNVASALRVRKGVQQGLLGQLGHFFRKPLQGQDLGQVRCVEEIGLLQKLQSAQVSSKFAELHENLSSGRAGNRSADPLKKAELPHRRRRAVEGGQNKPRRFILPGFEPEVAHWKYGFGCVSILVTGKHHTKHLRVGSFFPGHPNHADRHERCSRGLENTPQGLCLQFRKSFSIGSEGAWLTALHPELLAGRRQPFQALPHGVNKRVHLRQQSPILAAHTQKLPPGNLLPVFPGCTALGRVAEKHRESHPRARTKEHLRIAHGSGDGGDVHFGLHHGKVEGKRVAEQSHVLRNVLNYRNKNTGLFLGEERFQTLDLCLDKLSALPAEVQSSKRGNLL
eukprot:RCo001395